MTTDFAQTSMAYSTGSLIDATTIDGPAPYHWHTFKLPTSDADFKANGGQFEPDEVIGWELKVDDWRGGYLPIGDYAKGTPGGYGSSPIDGDYRAVSLSSLDHRFKRNVLLPPLLTTVSNAMASGQSPINVAWAVVFNTLVVSQASGSTAEKLWKETAGGGLTQITYHTQSPFALASIIQGSATATEQLCVMSANAPELLSDLTTGGPTSTGSMHANLAPAFAMAFSPINATTPGTGVNLFYANNGIWSLPITSAIGAAPTQVLSGVPNGGFGLGVDTLQKNLPQRWFLALPRVNSSSPLPISNSSNVPTAQAADVSMRIEHVSMEGNDRQLIPFSLNNIFWACLWQRQVVATNGLQIKTYDGEAEKDLNFLKGRAPNSDLTYSCQGLAVNGRDLISITCVNDNTAATTVVGNSYIQLEQYIPELDAWLPITSPYTPVRSISTASILPYSIGRSFINYGQPTLPVSKLTGNIYFSTLHGATGADWSYTFLAPPQTNPFDRYRQTGSTAYNSMPFAAGPLTATSPYFELPQLEGRWKRADQVVFLGDVDAGGTGAEVDVSLNGGGSIVFAAGLTDGARVAQTSETGDDAYWMQLQIAITLTRGSTTTKTPNGLPVVIRGRAYMVDPTGVGSEF